MATFSATSSDSDDTPSARGLRGRRRGGGRGRGSRRDVRPWRSNTTSAGIISIKRYWGKPGDITLRLTPEGQEQESVDIPVHSFAVAGISAWFNTRLEGAWGKPSASKRSRTECESQTDSIATHRVTIHDKFFPNEPATVPEAVLQHAYTNRHLPTDVNMLVWMVKRADYWGIKCTLDACYDKLTDKATSGNLGADFLTLSHTLPDCLSCTTQDYKSTLMAPALAGHFKDTLAVLNTPDLLEQFVQLPLSYLLMWLLRCSERGAQGHMDKVKVDHANTLVLLVTAWHDRQLQPLTDEQCEQLSAAMDTESMSLSFQLQALPHLVWWRTPRDSRGILSVLQLAADKPQPLPPSAYGVLSASSTSVALSGGVHWRDVNVFKGRLYYAGYIFQVEITKQEREVEDDDGDLDDGFALFASVGVSWPEVLIKHGVAKKVQQVCAAVRLTVKIGDVAWQRDVRAMGLEDGSPVIEPIHLHEYCTWQETTLFGTATPTVSVQLSRPM